MKANRFGILGRAFNHYIQRNRETLGNKRYDNDIELSIIICKNTKEMLQAWNLDKNKIEKICLKQRLFVSLGIVKDIITNYDLTKEEKIAKIENMLAIPEMKQAYECKKIQNKKEKIFCFCVRKHYIFPLKIYYKYFEKQRYGVQKKK